MMAHPDISNLQAQRVPLTVTGTPETMPAITDTPYPHLPNRYQVPLREHFDCVVRAMLRPGLQILDVGAGRKPTITPTGRPPGCYYAGLDVSERELQMAPPGSYNELWVRDVAEHVPALESRFDLVLSYQVLEHVKPLDIVLKNLRTYLRPGGVFVALLSGKFSAFGLINGVMPRRAGVWAMHKLIRRPPDTVFPAYYDRCWYGALQRMLSSWSNVDIMPIYCGATYFSFLRPLQRLYVRYENWSVHGKHDNLATHYLVVATR